MFSRNISHVIFNSNICSYVHRIANGSLNFGELQKNCGRFLHTTTGKKKNQIRFIKWNPSHSTAYDWKSDLVWMKAEGITLSIAFAISKQWKFIRTNRNTPWEHFYSENTLNRLLMICKSMRIKNWVDLLHFSSESNEGLLFFRCSNCIFFWHSQEHFIILQNEW